jgi:hypothetical protein
VLARCSLWAAAKKHRLKRRQHFAVLTAIDESEPFESYSSNGFFRSVGRDSIHVQAHFKSGRDWNPFLLIDAVLPVVVQHNSKRGDIVDRVCRDGDQQIWRWINCD